MPTEVCQKPGRGSHRFCTERCDSVRGRCVLPSTALGAIPALAATNRSVRPCSVTTRPGEGGETTGVSSLLRIGSFTARRCRPLPCRCMQGRVHRALAQNRARAFNSDAGLRAPKRNKQGPHVWPLCSASEGARSRSETLRAHGPETTSRRHRYPLAGFRRAPTDVHSA
jgi:hypothetical protein